MSRTPATQDARQVKRHGEKGRSRYTGAVVEKKKKKRPGCFCAGTPLDGTMRPRKMSREVTLAPSAESATIKVKVRLKSGLLFSKTLLLCATVSTVKSKNGCK